MKKSALISLSLLSLLLCAVVVAEVKYLYSGVGSKDTAVAVDDASEIPSRKTDMQECAPQPEQAKDEGDKKAAEEALKEELAGSVVPEEKPAEDIVQPEAPEETKSRSFKVKNCATGKINTLCQLPDGSVQFVDEKGKNLWTVKLPAPIVDGVSQIDFYNNGKIQFLFAVGDKLHLLDRLGREVSSFPKQLPFNVTDGPTQCKKNGKSYWKLESRAEKSHIYVDFSSKSMKILKELPQ